MSRINLTDDAELISQKIRKAKTDPEPLPSESDGLADRPEARNLVTIYAALTDTGNDAVLAECGGSQFGPFKTKLADLLVETLSPIRERLLNLRDDAKIDALLEDGAARARDLARPVLDAAYDAAGLQRSNRA